MEKEKHYRKLDLPMQRPINDRFAWLAGVAMVVLFLSCVAIAYFAQRHK